MKTEAQEEFNFIIKQTAKITLASAMVAHFKGYPDQAAKFFKAGLKAEKELEKISVSTRKEIEKAISGAMKELGMPTRL